MVKIDKKKWSKVLYKFKLIYIEIYNTIYVMIEKSYFQKYFINEEYKSLFKRKQKINLNIQIIILNFKI